MFETIKCVSVLIVIIIIVPRRNRGMDRDVHSEMDRDDTDLKDNVFFF